MLQNMKDAAMNNSEHSTEVVHDDLYITVLYQRKLKQYVISFDPDLDPRYTRHGFNMIKAENLQVVDHYYDTELNREIHVFMEAPDETS